MSWMTWACIAVMIAVLLWAVWCGERRRRAAQVRRKKRKGVIAMNELVRRCLGKTCVIYMGGFGGELEGTVEAVEDNWVSIRTKKTVELVNLDYINRIQEKQEKSRKA